MVVEIRRWHAPSVNRDTPKSRLKINVFYINFHSSDNQVLQCY
jgi:hypothetical protein